MAAPGAHHRAAARASSKAVVEVRLGSAELPVGRLVHMKDGPREFSQFAYDERWLASPEAFDISPDLQRVLGHQLRRAPGRDDSLFFLALGDTEPDAWGRRVIARAHAKVRRADPSLGALTELDYLCAVDDFSRVGALRLRDGKGTYLKTVARGRRSTPPLVELDRMLAASRAVEQGTETAEDLEYLQGKGTSLGGMRPKCTVLDEDGTLALGKFPSVADERSVTRGEVLALRLARRAGIDAASARIVPVRGSPVAVVRRFDRDAEGGRIPYMSGATLLQASCDDERAYTEIVDALRGASGAFAEDVRQLWRRLVFNLLITNVDDHLQNIGFLYAGSNRWRLSPAFDLNPFPDKDRESKTWLSEATGPVTSLEQLLEQAPRFAFPGEEARAVAHEVGVAVASWRAVAQGPDVGLAAGELDDFAPAFEHEDLRAALALG